MDEERRTNRVKISRPVNDNGSSKATIKYAELHLLRDEIKEIREKLVSVGESPDELTTDLDNSSSQDIMDKTFKDNKKSNTKKVIWKENENRPKNR